MRTLCLTATISLACSGLTGSGVFAQEGAGAPPKPGREHEVLKRDLGTWTGTMQVWIMGPDSDPITLPMKETNTLIHNGFWVATEFESGPYRGRGQTGYDPRKKKYVGTWVDNTSPYLSVMEGTYDAEKKEFTMAFDGYDATTGKLTKMKSVGREAPGKPRTFTMYRQNADGNEWVKVFVLTYDKKVE